MMLMMATFDDLAKKEEMLPVDYQETNHEGMQDDVKEKGGLAVAVF